MTHIGFIYTLERLWPYEDEETAYFGLNMSTGIIDGKLQNGQNTMLCPWTYGKVSSFELFMFHNMDKPEEGTRLSGELVQLPEHSIEYQALTDYLETKLSSSNVDDPTFASWEPTNIKMTAHWANLLGNISTYPGLIPHLLNLAFIFTTDKHKLTPGNILLATPVFNNKYTPKVPTENGTISTYTFMNQTAFIWDYNQEGIKAYQKGYTIEDKAPDTTPGSLIQLKDYWINQPAISKKNNTVELEKNWQQELEYRLAENMDLSRHLITIIPTNLFNNSKPSSNELENLRQLIICLIIDTANLGLLVSPDGVTPASLILTLAYKKFLKKEPISNPASATDEDDQREAKAHRAIEPLITALLESESQTGIFNSYPNWEVFLQGIPELSSLPSLQSINTTDIKQLATSLDEFANLLTSDKVLSKILVSAWSKVLHEKDAWESCKSYIPEVLQETALRKRYLLGLLGSKFDSIGLHNRAFQSPIWKSIITTDPHSEQSELSQILDNYVLMLYAYITGRCDIPIDNFSKVGDAVYKKIQEYQEIGKFKDRTPKVPINDLAATTITNICKSIKKYVESFKNNLETQPSKPTKAAHSIALQIDQAYHSGTIDDVLNRISGVGLLMREKGNDKKWSCLNIASLSFEYKQHQMNADNLLVPYRIQLTNQFKQVFINFDNFPLVAKSPIALAIHSNYNLSSHSDPAPSFNPFPANGLKELNPWGKYYSLKFDKKYEFIAFAIGLTGNLPKLLAESYTNNAKKTIYRPYSLTALDNFSSATLTNYIRTVEHKRLGQIGQIRTEFNDKDFTYPSTVRPLASDLGLTAPAKSSSPSNSSSSSVLLVWNIHENTPVIFHVRPPATDIATWDRTVTGNNLRKAVWADYLYYAPKDIEHKSEKDISIEDPAVCGLQITLRRLYCQTQDCETQKSKRCGCFVKHCYKSFPSLLPPKKQNQLGSGFEEVQKNKIEFQCSWVKFPGQPDLLVEEKVNDPVQVKIPEQQVFELYIHSVIPESEKVKFESSILFSEISDYPDKTQKYYLSNNNPFRLLIEGATAEMPCSQTLWEALDINLDFDSSSLVTTLQTSLFAANHYFAFIKEIELKKQSWRWLGRPFKYPKVMDTHIESFNDNDINHLQDALECEIELFGNRSDQDCMRFTKQVNFVEDLSLKVDKSVVLYSADLTNQPEAQYFRFSVTAKSRYEGLPEMQIQSFESSCSLHDRLPIRNNEQSPPYYTNWRRLPVPCRADIHTSIPKPHIKLVIPLLNKHSLNAMPDFLVILDEQWFQVGGIAETLKIEVETTKNSKFPDDPKYVFGPDPILQAQAYPADIPIDFSKIDPVAIGTTFDMATNAPQFIHTCFLIPGPTINSHPPFKEYDTGFAKFRFRRQIKSFLSEQPLLSEPTDPHWVYFLPDFDSFSVLEDGSQKDYKVDELNFEITSDFHLIFKGPGDYLCPTPSTNSNGFELWILLTREITDVFGRKDQEAFVRLFQIDKKGTIFPKIQANQSTLFTSPTEHNWKLRLLEIQFPIADRNHPPKFDNIFEELFPETTLDNQAVDATARIVKMSMPFDIKALQNETSFQLF